MAKDYSKYNVEGIAQNLGKTKIALTVVADFTQKNSIGFAELLDIFPDECQGGIHGVFRREQDVVDHKRYYMKSPITLSDGQTIVVSNQWGKDNIGLFIEKCVSLGYEVNKIESNSSAAENSMINFKDLSIPAFIDLLLQNASDHDALVDFFEQLENAIEMDHSLIPFGLIAMKQTENTDVFAESFMFERRFNFQDDFSQPLSVIEWEPLINLVLNNHEISAEDVLTDDAIKKDFLNLLSCYFYYTLMTTIIQEKDPQFMAEFIVAQSKLSKIEIEEWYDSDDFIADHILDFITYAFGFDVRSEEYANECTVLEHSFISMNYESGYDYVKLSSDIIETYS